MKHPFILPLALTAALASCAQPTRPHAAAATQPPAVQVLECGQLLDVRSGRLIPNERILVEGTRIAAVGPQVVIPRGARVIDLRRDAVLPGLIDAHTHITYHFDPGGHFGGSSLETSAQAMQAAQENARLTLQAGFTTIRNLGAGGGTDLRLRDAVERGETPGPRMVVSGSPLLPGDLPSDPATRLDAIRDYVRARVREGVDVIKIFEGVDDRGEPLISEDEIRAAVQEATRAGRRVAVHAHEASTIKAAVRGGCTSIEHGSYLDAEAIRLMVQHHTTLVPTLYLPTYYLQHQDRFDFDSATWDFFRQLQAHNLDNLRRARRAGIRVVCGSDAVAGAHGHNARELEWLVKAGMTPAEAIRAATVDAANLLGLDNLVGEIRPGKMADIIAVNGNPLHDITLLQHVSFVMKGGRVFRRKQ